MDQAILEKVCQQVYKKFPEVSGVKPTVKSQVVAEGKNYLLTFKGSATTEDGKALPRIIRVVTNEKGKVIKFSTSR
jgi:hypothetical protein